MSRHYYAVYWPYGVNTFNFDHEPIGTVVPFDTAKARDAYVAADRFDGNFHRSMPDYRLTRKMMLEALREFRSLDSRVGCTALSRMAGSPLRSSWGSTMKSRCCDD